MRPNIVILMLSCVLVFAGCKSTTGNHMPPALETHAKPEEGSIAAVSEKSSKPVEISRTMADLNGTLATARLLYDDVKLTLEVSDAHIDVPVCSIEGFPGALLGEHVETRVTALREETAAGNPFLVSIVWPTNKIGSTVELWLFSYVNKNLTLSWSLTDETPAVKTTPLDARTLSVSIPSYRLQQSVPVSEEDAKRLNLDQSGAAQSAASNLVQLGTPTHYEVRDYDGDGHDEIAVNQLMYLGAPPFVLTRLYTFYRINEGTIAPAAAFFSQYPQSDLVDLLMKGEQLPTNSKLLSAKLENKLGVPVEQGIQTLQDLRRKKILDERNGLICFTFNN